MKAPQLVIDEEEEIDEDITPTNEIDNDNIFGIPIVIFFYKIQFYFSELTITNFLFVVFKTHYS